MAGAVPAWLEDELATPRPADVIAAMAAAGQRLAIAESLTGGLVAAELIRPAGASAVVSGGVVAYATEIKHTLLGVDAVLLDDHGPVHPVVAEQMAAGARRALAVDGRPADIGVSTTGVAGPDPQGGQPPGTVYIGLSSAEETVSYRLFIDGDRDRIRSATVAAVLRMLGDRVLF